MDALFLLGMVCDLLYGCDIVLAFRSGYYDNGNKVMMRNAIRRSYISNFWSLNKRSFFRDVVSTIPIDLVEFLNPNFRGSLRLTRLIRSPRIFLIMQELLDRAVRCRALN